MLCRKIVGIGWNYRAHAKELHSPLPTTPLMFLKPSSSIIEPPQPIQLPHGFQVDHEGIPTS
jgi:2-keto-4-pentenoate hydratase/2-oxohepta-3-ene-1,7-dioic acid hydratase in catechol pathway